MNQPPQPSLAADTPIAAYHDELRTIAARLHDLAGRLAVHPVEHALMCPQLTMAHIRISAALRSVQDAEQCLRSMTDDKVKGHWRLMRKDQQIFARPRIEVMRSIMFNHWYHHRGQLSVYLRLLDVPVPVIYGRSADEDGFA